nr:hypothetical protein [bacterium]
NKQEISMPLKVMEAETRTVPLMMSGYDANPHFYYADPYRSLCPGDTFQAYPGGYYYFYDEDVNYNYYDDWYIADNTDAITWGMTDDSAETITIDGAGLITVSENAQDGDYGYPLYTADGFTPDKQEYGIIKATTE